MQYSVFVANFSRVVLDMGKADDGGSDQPRMFYFIFSLERLRFDLKLTAGFSLSSKLK